MAATAISRIREAEERASAQSIEDALIYIGASDVKNPPSDSMLWWDQTFDLTGNKDDAAIPAADQWTDSAFMGAMPGSRYTLVTGTSIAAESIKRMRSLGAIEYGVRGLLKVSRTLINNSGTARIDRFSCQLIGNEWMPDTGKNAGKTFRRTTGGGRNGRWSEFFVRDIPAEVMVLPVSVVLTHLCRSRNWIVSFGSGLPQKVSLPTDAIGVRELFRLRDVPEGRTRRAALLHWVSQHYRKNRKDPEIEHSVRQHLRGAREWEWFGLNCVIKPHDDPACS